MISWEGKSCQGMKYYGRDRGSTIMGTAGTVLLDRDGYEIYDLKGNKTSEFKAGSASTSSDLIGRDSMTDAHFANFIAGIRKGEKLNAPIVEGNIAVTMLELSNIAWEVNRELHLDTKGGRIQNDPDAMKMWGREYEKGLSTACLKKDTVSRRDFVRSTALVSAAFAAPGSVFALAQTPLSADEPVRLGLASYTFRNFNRAQLIGFMKQLNVFALNAKDVKDHLPIDPQEESVAFADYAAAGIKLHATGAIYFPKDEDADIRTKFEYCKRAGIGVIVAGDPATDTLSRIEKFVKEYDIRIAIHNHGPEDKLWRSPLDVLKAVNENGSAHRVLHRCRAYGSRRHGCGAGNPRSRPKVV